MTQPAVKPAPGWVFALVAVVLAGAGVWMAVNTVHTFERVASERHGTIIVSGCTFSQHGTHTDIYRCDGRFTADDRSFRTYVDFHNTGRLGAGDHATGIVDGPGDHTADVESHWEIGVKLSITLALAGATVGVLFLGRRVRRIRRRARNMAR